MSVEKIIGTGVALVTPFDKYGAVDYKDLSRIIKHVSEGGAEYLVILGTTGESATVTPTERFKIIEFIIENNPKNLPLVLGYGSNNTLKLKSALQEFKQYPFEAVLSVSPYYNRPSQRGIIRHYNEVADASPFPIILYNVPPRTGSNIDASTTIELSEHVNIIGTKEAAGDLTQCANILANTDSNFLVVSGEDSLTLPLIAMGGKGAISVIANLQPQLFSNMVRLALKGDFAASTEIHFQLLKGYELVSSEGNPVSVKAGMETLGLLRKEVRMPLHEASDKLMSAFNSYLK